MYINNMITLLQKLKKGILDSISGQTCACFCFFRKRRMLIESSSIFRHSPWRLMNDIWNDIIKEQDYTVEKESYEKDEERWKTLFWALYVEESRFYDYSSFAWNHEGVSLYKNEEDPATFHKSGNDKDLLTINPPMMFIAKGDLLLSDYNEVIFKLPNNHEVSDEQQIMELKNSILSGTNKLAQDFMTKFNVTDDIFKQIMGSYESTVARLLKSLALLQQAQWYNKKEMKKFQFPTTNDKGGFTIRLDKDTCFLGFESPDEFLKIMHEKRELHHCLVHLIPHYDHGVELYARIIIHPTITHSLLLPCLECDQ